MNTFAIDQSIVREITRSFSASRELGQKTTADLSRVEARASWSPRACVAFSTLSLLLRLKEMLGRIFRRPKTSALIQSRAAYRNRRHVP